MHELYDSTSLTPISVAKTSGFIDWASQPSIFKHYPEFLFRYPFGEHTQLRVIELARMVTSRSLIAGKPYNRLSPPSAGNLHPTELYVQIRGIKGILSGIYHVDAGAGKLVLIEEVGKRGLEPSLNLQNRYDGMIFILSSVPFRSEWKYSKRAIRYCYLDAGHQIGALSTSLNLFGHSATILSEYDVDEISTMMGFKDEERVCAVMAVGEDTQKGVETMKKPLMYVSPSDYTDSNTVVASLLKDSQPLKDAALPYIDPVDEKNIITRRSARVFSGLCMEKKSFEHFMHILDESINPLTSYIVVLKDDVREAGVYVDDKLIKKGYFSDEMSRLLLDQSFIKSANIITVMTAKDFSSNNLMLAGAFGHKLYIEAQSKGVGCSGIGAFYDKKLQNFLGSDEYILYVCVIGSDK